MEKCPYCGHDNIETVKVCEKCRAELPVIHQEKPEQPKKAEPKVKE